MKEKEKEKEKEEGKEKEEEDYSMPGDLLVVGSGIHCLQVDRDSVRRDSELGHMLITCGKLSNQAPSVKTRLSSSGCCSAK